MKDYKHLLLLFDKYLAAHAASLSHKSPSQLYEPEAYILSLGGKRLRPLLALIACDLFDADAKRAAGSALAVELFHNFSLIHDDILDAAPLRRGKPTVHEKWNTNTAILSGDVMLVKAAQALEQYPDKEFKKLSALFNSTAIEVCEGQQLDMNFESRKDVPVEEYIEMITKKTAVLLGCSLQMGAVNAGANEQNQKHLYEFGKHLGISFQLLDDLLDVFAGDAEKFGKTQGGDINANKKTFLLLKAIELGNKEQKKQISEILSKPKGEAKVSEMVAVYQTLGVKELCTVAADEHTKMALKALDHIVCNSAKKETLKNFATELLMRQV